MKGHGGFTLIELMLVIAIIGILSALVTPNLLQARTRAYDITTLAWTRECVTAVETSRNSLTGVIPGAGDCAGLVGKNLPAAVDTDGTITLSNGGVDFTIAGVVSKGNATYGYDGSEITQ